MSNTRQTVAIVAAWHQALNQGDVDKLVQLTAEDVAIGGPRGRASGAQVLREWFGRASVKLEPVEYFARDQLVVVQENGTWFDPNNKQLIAQQTVATVFLVNDGVIHRIVRHDTVEAALDDAGLTLANQVQP